MNIFAPTNSKNASVAELVDALDSKSCAFGRAGSIPARGTKVRVRNESESDHLNSDFFFRTQTPTHSF